MPDLDLDLLEALPLDLFDLGIWSALKDSNAQTEETYAEHSRGEFRLCCSRTRKLADLLITSAILNKATAATSGTESEQRAARSQQMEQGCAFLGRLPRLAGLTLLNWQDEPHLITCLHAYGAASRGRVTTLSLCPGVRLNGGAVTITPATSRTLRQSYPRLETLNLHKNHFRADLKLEGNVFGPLVDSQLRTLLLNSGPCPTEVVRSLARLSQLHSLDARFGVATQQLHLLSSLASLTHCSMRQSPPATLTDATALLSLTRLTHLRVNLQHGNAAAIASAASTAAAAPTPCPTMQSAVRLLGGLRQLHTLDLSDDFTVDDEVWGQLCQLTLLTRLGVGAFQLQRPVPGRPPGIRSLHSHSDGWHTPAQLLQMLLPLAPLHRLTDLQCGRIDVELPSATTYRLQQEGQQQPQQAAPPSAAALTSEASKMAAVLHRVAQLLAATPVLKKLCFGSWEDTETLSLSAISCSLQPLERHLRTLELYQLDLQGCDWGELARCLPGLLQLDLADCQLSYTAPAAVGVLWPALEGLSVCGCGGLTSEGWKMLCAARAGPLVVEAFLSAGVAAEGVEVQMCVYGRENIELVLNH